MAPVAFIEHDIADAGTCLVTGGSRGTLFTLVPVPVVVDIAYCTGTRTSLAAQEVTTVETAVEDLIIVLSDWTVHACSRAVTGSYATRVVRIGSRVRSVEIAGGAIGSSLEWVIGLIRTIIAA